MPDGTNILIEENGTLIVLILNSKQTVTSGQDPTHSLLLNWFISSSAICILSL